MLSTITVIAILNSEHNEVVAYAYDAWGKQVGCAGLMADSLGKENPFRYRGYVFDEETGLYYLRSRNYHPERGRFINEDTLLGQAGTLLSHNLYAYCVNNPANDSEPSGQGPLGLLALAAMALGLLGLSGCSYSGPDLNTNVNAKTDKGRPAMTDVMDGEDKAKASKDVTVRYIQELLNAGGYLDEKFVDGVYGDFTIQAVEKFQKDYNDGKLSPKPSKEHQLKEDGYAGLHTQHALMYVFGEMEEVDWWYLDK